MISPPGSEPLLHCNWVLHSYQGELRWHKMFRKPFTNLARMSTGICRGTCRLATNLLNVCSSCSSFAEQSPHLMRQDLRYDSCWTVHGFADVWTFKETDTQSSHRQLVACLCHDCAACTAHTSSLILLTLQMQKVSLQSEVGVWGEVERGFGRTGVQSFAIEGVLGELQVSPTLLRRCCDIVV